MNNVLCDVNVCGHVCARGLYACLPKVFRLHCIIINIPCVVGGGGGVEEITG